MSSAPDRTGPHRRLAVLEAEVARLRAALAATGLSAGDARAATAAAESATRLARTNAASAAAGHARAMAAGRAELADAAALNAQLRDLNTALRASEERFSAVIESATDNAIISMDSDGRITGWSPGAERMFGWTEAEALGQDGAMVWTPEDRAAGMPERERQAADAAGSMADERWHIRRDGTRFWGSGHLTPLRNGRPRGYLKVLRDRTAERRAEEALRESEARFRALATAGTSMMYRMSPDWRRMHELDGRSILADTPEPIEDWADRYILPEDRPTVWAAIGDAIRTRSIFELEHRVRRADGGVGWVLSRAVPILGPDGEVAEWFGTGTDVTERRRAEERKAFLLGLSDALRPLADPIEVMAVASEALGRHLAAGRCGYGEVDATGEFFTVERDWTDGVMASFKGRHRLVDFGPEFTAAYRAGRTVLIDDAFADARAQGAEAAFEAAGGVRASLGVPLIKQGRFVAGLFVQQVPARRWSAEEEALALDVAERTWAAVERARAEAALRESEVGHRALVEALDEGVLVIERLPLRPDGLRDWLYVAMNPAVQRMFRIGDLTGQTVRDNFPDEDEGWYDIYDRALETGEVARFEREAASQAMFLQMYVARIGAPERQRLMLVIQDVTARRRTEAALRESEARGAFLLALTDALRPLADPAEIEGAACRLLAERLDADRAYYVEVDEAAGTARVERDFVRGDAPSLAGEHRVADFAWPVAILRRGECQVVADTQASALVPPADRPACAALRIIACMGAPLIKDGRLVGALCVTASAPRAWTGGEVGLLQEVAERVWSAVARARAEAALRASDERFRIIVESARDYAIFVTDPERRVVTWPAGAEAVFGWRAEEILGRPADILWTPEDRAEGAPERETAEAREAGHAPNVRWHQRKDGVRVFIEGSVRPLRGPAGELQGFLKVGQDVTERRRTEEALRVSEARFRGFAENSADVLWIVDGGGTRVEYLSPAFEAVFGEPRDGVMADLGRFLELVHPDDRGAIAGLLPRALAGETAIAHYRVVRPSDGQVTHLRDTGFPIRDAAGAVTRVAGIVQDVNDIVRATATLEAEKERFRTLVEGIPQLAWRSAAHGRWTWASPQWTAFTGLSVEASRGLGWLDAVHPEDRAGAMAAWDRASQGDVFEADYRLRHHAGGGWRWFQTRGLPVRDATGSAIEWLSTSTDMDEQVRAREALARNAEELEARVRERTSELMAAEESLRQSQKMEAIGQLTGGIAHDFNNMLQGVVGGLDMARRRLDEGRGEDTTRYMVAARDAAGRAAGLTRRLLAFARRQRLEPRAVDTDVLVSGMADLVRRTVGPAIALELVLRDGRWSVLCDPSELESAILNLCINARDAMPGGGRLTITTEELHLSAADLRRTDEAPPGDYVAIHVADTGTGMPPEILDRVFEPFFTTKPQGQGTGLGLSQVWGFVRQSGGLLRIASAPGQGTIVRILLPRGAADQPRADVEAAPTPDAGPAAGTVLLVDDETAARVPAGERLRDLGYRVVEAPDGPTALRLLDGGLRPDLLVTDMGLPGGMNGRQVAEAARERMPELPVLFITGYAGTALPPGSEVIGKPFDLDALARRVQARLAVERDGAVSRA